MKAQTENLVLHQSLYYVLFLFAGASLALVAERALGWGNYLWEITYATYFFFAIIHTWFILTLLFIQEVKKKKYPKYIDQKMAVIVPCFNEDAALLEQSLVSILTAEGNKKVIVVDDGSTNQVKDILSRYDQYPNLTVKYHSTNKGKREAIYTAVTSDIEGCKFVVVTDSDTILDRYALVNVVSPLLMPKIGAVSGDVKLINEKQNFVTKMIGSYYWVALNIHRKAQSALGMVSCCSGALAAYKVEFMRQNVLAFVNEEFLGQKCTYSDDRHLTNLVLKSGYDVVYQPEAVAFTHTPFNYRDFIKQQLRWRRGFIQEAIFSLSFLWKRKPVLFLEIFIWELVMPFFSLGMIILLYLQALFNPLFFIASLIPSLITLAVIQHLPIIFYAPRKIPGLIHYSFFSHFVMYWLGIYALVTLRKKNWATR